jgi:hypothetical protein
MRHPTETLLQGAPNDPVPPNAFDELELRAPISGLHQPREGSTDVVDLPIQRSKYLSCLRALNSLVDNGRELQHMTSVTLAKLLTSPMTASRSRTRGSSRASSSARW